MTEPIKIIYDDTDAGGWVIRDYRSANAFRDYDEQVYGNEVARDASFAEVIAEYVPNEDVSIVRVSRDMRSNLYEYAYDGDLDDIREALD